MKLLSIIIPVYNERATISKLIEKIESLDFKENQIELVIVDDGSIDGTSELLEENLSKRHKVVHHDKNMGKGMAIRTGLHCANGDIFVIQDADLEYNPEDIVSMLTHFIKNDLDALYGSRVMYTGSKKYSSYIYHIGGLLVTWWTNLLYGAKITDEATCYKMFTRNALDKISLKCTGFEFCPEITAKFLKAKIAISEVPISYNPRSKKEGKKIKLSDGIIALVTLLRIRFSKYDR